MEDEKILWLTDFLGIGYMHKPTGWLVFPVFTSRSNAEKLWDEQVESIDEKNLRIRFIEQDNEYKFLLYARPSVPGKVTIVFYRSLRASKTYNLFKASFSGKVCFTFGVIGDGVHPEHLNDYKLVTDVKFVKAAEVEENSIEWIAEEVQRQARSKQGYN